ncbi:hypothetical protein RFI_12634 [Reticulomyxa filosa]|uniref:Uncharacterized protein n=1 Tax=Reticulomyxa filosa TaxID=46433 RepID=X6NF40_RETFI|nr:hypothetical protein RFI_12634 [Reticulomyxa filosa]|eukprot:ETO24523.1 hypothetical protein RFI_12634 [Reticulomyxa filosa]
MKDMSEIFLNKHFSQLSKTSVYSLQFLRHYSTANGRPMRGSATRVLWSVPQLPVKLKEEIECIHKVKTRTFYEKVVGLNVVGDSAGIVIRGNNTKYLNEVARIIRTCCKVAQKNRNFFNAKFQENVCPRQMKKKI